MTDEVKIFSNISDDVIEFDDKDDFQRYYAKNKDYVDKFTTRGLNVKYKIPNYKIGRSHGVITLYPLKDSQQQSTSTQNDTDETGLTVHQKLNKLNGMIKNVLDQIEELNELIYDIKNEQQQQQQKTHQTTQPRPQIPIPNINNSRFSAY